MLAGFDPLIEAHLRSQLGDAGYEKHKLVCLATRMARVDV